MFYLPSLRPSPSIDIFSSILIFRGLQSTNNLMFVYILPGINIEGSLGFESLVTRREKYSCHKYFARIF